MPNLEHAIMIARSHVTTDSHSYETGRATARALTSDFEGTSTLALVYLTVNHHAKVFLKGLSEVLGPEVQIVGCSAQGVMGRGVVREDGFGASAMPCGGDRIVTSSAYADDIASDTSAKGQALGRALRQGLSAPPRFVALPVLGRAVTLEESLDLQQQLASAEAWIGMMPWGEIYTVASRLAFHNYSYPILAITE